MILVAFILTMVYHTTQNEYTDYVGDFQVLPNFFTERLYPVNPWIYLIHNRGTKHKVYIQKVTGKRLKLYSDEWRGFLSDSRYTNVATFHFIREEEDCYYVTAYDNAGYECNGYNLAEVGYRQRRCLVTLGHLQESPVSPIINH